MNNISILRFSKLGFFSLSLICSLLLLSCGKPTKPNTFSISGFVINADKIGLDNATILLYGSETIDDTITVFKDDFPLHGADIDMYYNFDHRTLMPEAQTTTNSDGSFLLSQIPEGIFKLVAFKQGFGFVYSESIYISQNEENVQMELNPVIPLGAAITSDTVFLSNRIYQMSSDLAILPDVTANVGNNVTILVPPTNKINVYGLLNTSQTSSLKIMSSDKLYSSSNQDSVIGRFDSVNFYFQSDVVLQNIKLQNCSLGIRFSDSPNTSLINFYSDSEYQSVAIARSSGFKLSRCTITNSAEISRGAVSVENSSGTSIEKCHFFRNKQGVRFAESQETRVTNNYFHLNTICDLGYDTNGAGTAQYNTFRNSRVAIENYRGQIYANYNDIEAIIGIYSYRVNAWFSAKFNNFNCSQYGIKSQCMYWDPTILHLDGTKNYWFTTDTSTIEQKIYDRDNESPNDENYNLLVTIVDYLPISYALNPAGVYN